ncbi:MAG: T9SS type A sorting domain-containing protein [Bacteroidota bacterium]
MATRAFSLLIFLLIGQLVTATHIIGSDWQYKCLNTSGDYEITLILYRDCSGIPLCPGTCGDSCSVFTDIKGGTSGCSGVSYGTLKLQLVSVRDVNLNPRCPNVKNTCSNMGCVTPGTFTPGVERFEFRAVINLGPSSGIPQSCCTVKFTYSICCRSSGISTGAAGANFYTEMSVNRCLSTPAVNSSPVFTNDVPHILCTNQPATINCGGIDPDLDSLAYAFVPSLSSAGASVPYSPPYSFDKPMPWTGPTTGQFPNGIRCNSITGDISFTPAGPSNFEGIIAIGIEQWRWNTTTKKYELMGITRRDMMVWLKSCETNSSPFLTTQPALIPGTSTPRTSWLFYAGRQNCFELTANDSNLTDTTFLSWNGALANRGATFLPTYNPSQRRINGPREDRYRFCWTPADSNIRTQPYSFTVKAEDNRCPLNGSSERTIQLYVIAPPIIGKTDIQNPVCNQFHFATAINPSPGWYNYIDWTVTRTPGDRNFEGPVSSYRTNGFLSGVQFGSSGRYYIRQDITLFYAGNLNTQISILDSVDVAQNGFAFNASDTFFCSSQPILVRPNLFNPANDTLTYEWTSMQNPTNVLSTADTLYIAFEPTKQVYVLYINNNKGCMLRDTFVVKVMPDAISTKIWGNTSPSVDQSCVYEVVNTPDVTYLWRIENGNFLYGQGTHKVTVAWNSIGEGKLFCNETADGCMRDTLNLTVTVTPPSLSVQDASSTNAFMLFPNPAQTKLYLKSDSEKPVKMELMDMSGRMIEIRFTEEQPGVWQINVAELPDGLYTVSVYTENGSRWIQRFRKSAAQVH